MSIKRIEQNIPIVGVDKFRASHPDECIDNPTHLKLSLYYSTGGINYFTSKNEARGYYLSVSPERIEKHDYGNTIATSLMSGVKDLVLEVSRQSDKQMEIATTIACERAKALLDWCMREYGTKYEAPAEYFPNALKRPVPNQAVKTTVTKQDEKPVEGARPIRSMKLLTAEIIRRLEKHPFGSQDGKLDDAVVLVKYFGGSMATWLVTEGERQEDGDWLFFGKVTLGYEWEWGYFTLFELEQMKFPPFGLGVERDMYLGNKVTVKELAA